MSKSTTPVLRWSESLQMYELSVAGGRGRSVGADDGSDEWLTVLEAAGSFAFEGRAGRLSVIREQRPRGAGYWYAYRSTDRRTRKRYLGRASNITLARLEEIAAALSPVSEKQLPRQDKAMNIVPASLLLSKLQPPRLPGSLIARPHLLRRLDAIAERKIKITLLVAPAGFGKTTLIGQWLKERFSDQSQLAWVSLDSGDNDLYRFWRLLFTSCQLWQPQSGRTALAALAAAWQPPFASPPLDAILTTFLNDLARQQSGDGLLVLDDYSCIQEPRIHETVSFFLQHLPQPFQVLLLTRVEPDQLPLLRWRAQGVLSELHVTELRFSVEETTAFVQQTFPEPLSATALAELDASLQGWVAGLRLLSFARPAQLTADAIERTSGWSEPGPDLSVSPYQPLLDYLVTEVLDAQPPPLQHRLLQLSVPERLNGSLCEAIIPTENGRVLLESLAQSGLFLEILDGSWYRFHALFLEALRREAGTRLDADERHGIAQRASRWYEQHGLLTEAIETSLQAREFERAARLIERTGEREELSELSMVQRWLSVMPEPTLKTHPLLCWLAALALQLHQDTISIVDQQRVDILLGMAEAVWREADQRDFLGLLPTFHALRSWRSGQIAPAIDYARQALEQLPEGNAETPLKLFRGICLFMTGIGAMYEEQFQVARASFLEAYQRGLQHSDQHFSRGMLLLAASCCYILGELQQAHEYYQQAHAAASQAEDREVLAQVLLGLATLSFEWNQQGQAEQQANEALSLALEEEADLHHAAALFLVQLSYARGELTSAQQQLTTLLAQLQLNTTQGEEPRLPAALLLAARLGLARADFPYVERIIAMPILQQEELTAIVRARLLMAQGNSRHAIQLLEPRLGTMREWRPRIELQIVLALAYAASQDGQGARHWLQQALAQARAEGLVQIFVAEGDVLASLLRQLLPIQVEPVLRTYAQQLLRAILSEHNEGTQQAGPALTAQERRVLRLLATGSSNQQIARELVVSVNTVKDHLKHIYQKLGVNNRLQASQLAQQLNLLP